MESYTDCANGIIGDTELAPLKKRLELDLKCEDFDEVLEIIGTQGTYQKLLLYAVVSPIITILPFLSLNTIFLLYQPDHWCHIPGRDNSTDLETWKRLHIPLDFERAIGPGGQTKFSQCTMYDGNRSVVKCPLGWDYDRTEYESTIPTEYDWVCERKDYSTNAFTSQAVGNAIGTMIFGHMADKIGRKPIFFLTLIVNVVFRLGSFYTVHSNRMFLVMQFLVGTGFPMMYIAPSMIVAEVCDKAYRGWVYAVTWMIWVVGMSALPVVVWFFGSWFIIGLSTTLPGVVLFLYWFHLPESPRWLLSAGRLEESAKVLMQIAEINGTSENLTKSQLDKALQRLYDKQEKTQGAVGVWTLFSRLRLAKNTILLTLCWSINVVVYYGITLNTTHMSGNQFVNFFLLALIELPSGYVGGYLVDKVGRRWTQVSFFCCCAFTCAAAAIAVQFMSQPVFEIATVIVAKFAVTVTFLVVYLQGTEIFPTQLRSTGNGFASTVAAASGITGPTMVALGVYNLSYPYWIMGILCVIGMLSSAFLPETLNQNLPETIDDANDFGRHNKFWSLYPQPIPKASCNNSPML